MTKLICSCTCFTPTVLLGRSDNLSAVVDLCLWVFLRLPVRRESESIVSSTKVLTVCMCTQVLSVELLFTAVENEVPVKRCSFV